VIKKGSVLSANIALEDFYDSFLFLLILQWQCKKWVVVNWLKKKLSENIILEKLP